MENRKIKFRAFYKGQIIYNINLEVTRGEHYFTDGKDILLDVPLMQATGLKDKIGKEIWEGDLVKRNGHIRKVVFSDGAFCLWGIKQFEGTLDPMTVMFHGSALYNFISDIEVIGNVFENTELSVGKI
jgi:uncharacterized phage protein (TIGR01671 family)